MLKLHFIKSINEHVQIKSRGTHFNNHTTKRKTFNNGVRQVWTTSPGLGASMVLAASFGAVNGYGLHVRS